MPPEALAPAQCPDARDPAAAEVRDAEGLLASARETAMEKLRRRRRVQKRREEKAVASVRDARKGEAAAAPGAFEERPNRSLIEGVVSDQVPRHVPHLYLRAVVTPGRLVADTSGDGVTNAVAALGEPPKTKTRAGVTAAAAIGDAMACGTEDGDVGRFLRLFTTLPLDEIARLEALEGAELNEAKKVLAQSSPSTSSSAPARLSKVGGPPRRQLAPMKASRKMLEEALLPMTSSERMAARAAQRMVYGPSVADRLADEIAADMCHCGVEKWAS